MEKVLLKFLLNKHKRAHTHTTCDNWIKWQDLYKSVAFCQTHTHNAQKIGMKIFREEKTNKNVWGRRSFYYYLCFMNYIPLLRQTRSFEIKFL